LLSFTQEELDPESTQAMRKGLDGASIALFDILTEARSLQEHHGGRQASCRWSHGTPQGGETFDRPWARLVSDMGWGADADQEFTLV